MGMSNSRARLRIAVNIALDGVLAAFGVLAACWLADPAHPEPNPWVLPLAGAAAIWLVGVPFGLSRQHWRFTALRDLTTIASVVVLAALLIVLLLVGIGTALPSASFPVILTITLGLGLTAPRLFYRIARRPAQAATEAAESALLVGTGEGAELFLSALARERPARFAVLGLLALSARETGRRIHGLPILGSLDQAELVLERLANEGALPGLIILASAEIEGPALQTLLAAAEARGLRVARAPSPTALAPADAAGLVLRPIAIEDLLNRKQVALDREGMARLIQGRRVLVTGAGGTIGAELARQVAGLGPEQLILLDHGEYALWQIDMELSESFPAVRRQAVIADIRDAARMMRVCQSMRPELVFHAAALKHVPMVEANQLEGLATNAAGTRHVADAARAAGAALMVLISTDKAVNPSSIMGASKRLAEMYCQGLDIAARQAQSGMRCVTVRFGNVLGSTGSVVPLFRRQLERGLPLTVTHPDMQRYFMTVREAVSLVLQASVVGSGDGALPAQDGGIFVLDMGEPVKIVDLARQMIRLAGLRPDIDVPIRFTGLRPGEKLFEELFHGRERPVPTGHEGLLMAAPRIVDLATIGRAIDLIDQAAQSGDASAALGELARLVPEFAHNAG
jgi:O-antigen biosynthesis protein WbqV